MLLNCISVESRFKTSEYLNESSHLLNFKAEKSQNQINLSSISSFKLNTKKAKFKDTDNNNQIFFINKSPEFTSTDNVTCVNHQGDAIKEDFSMKVKFLANPSNETGYTGIGFSTYQLGKNKQNKTQPPTNSEKLEENIWIGMIKHKNQNKKQWLMTDNFAIAENGRWKKTPFSTFKVGDTITLFRNKNEIGFRVNDNPNDYKYFLKEDLFVVLCSKKEQTQLKVIHFSKRPLSLVDSSASLGKKDTLENKLKVFQNKYKEEEDNIDNKSALSIVAKILYSNPVVNAEGIDGNPTLNAGEQIKNTQMLQSPNKKYTVEIRNAELVVVEDSHLPTEGVIWKNGTVGESPGTGQVLGLLEDSTLYLQTAGKPDYYWTNKDRLNRNKFTAPYTALIKDNGEFVVQDSNHSAIWTTNSAVVNEHDCIGSFLSKNLPLVDGQCIKSSQRKYKLCNKNGIFTVKDPNSKVKWKNLTAKNTKAELLLDMSCNITIRKKTSSDREEDESYQTLWKVPTGANECVLIVNDEGAVEVKSRENATAVLWTSNPLVAKIDKSNNNQNNTAGANLANLAGNNPLSNPPNTNNQSNPNQNNQENDPNDPNYHNLDAKDPNSDEQNSIMEDGQ